MLPAPKCLAIGRAGGRSIEPPPPARSSRDAYTGHHRSGTADIADGDPVGGIFWPGVLWLHRHDEAFRQRASDVAGVWGYLTMIQIRLRYQGLGVTWVESAIVRCFGLI